MPDGFDFGVFRTFDRAAPRAPDLARARRVETWYGAQLRKVAKTITDIVGAFGPAHPEALAEIDTQGMAGALERYTQVLGTWAVAVGRRMVTEVARKERSVWADHSRDMSRALRDEILNAPTGEVLRRRLADQVPLITSLPSDAAARVHSLTLEGITQGTRAKEIAARIMETGEVSQGRAMLIARTEVSRTATELTMARMMAIGSTSYVWKTVGDSDVRPSHKALNGKVFRWDDPPECDPGYRAHPGCIFNCRCLPRPILPDVE